MDDKLKDLGKAEKVKAVKVLLNRLLDERLKIKASHEQTLRAEIITVIQGHQ